MARLGQCTGWGKHKPCPGRVTHSQGQPATVCDCVPCHGEEVSDDNDDH